MNTVLQKKNLKDGYYYSGYLHQHYCVVTTDQPLVIGKWDAKSNSFLFWDYDGNRKTKRSIASMCDIDNMNEIECGFMAIKEIFPKDEHVIE